MKNHSRYYTIALLSICILIIGGGYYFVIKTLWSKAASVATYKNEIISGEQKKQFSNIMLKSFEAARSDISLLQNFFVKKQSEVDFIEYVEQTAKSQGLEIVIDTVSLDSPKNIAAYKMEYLVLSFNVKGPWSRVWNFSRMLEVLPYSINIRSLALLKEGGGETDLTSVGAWKGVYTIKVLKKK
jgi:Tfp pilus assembly protein PilO